MNKSLSLRKGKRQLKAQRHKTVWHRLKATHDISKGWWRPE